MGIIMIKLYFICYIFFATFCYASEGNLSDKLDTLVRSSSVADPTFNGSNDGLVQTFLSEEFQRSLLEGRETQNGDYSFANRSRKLLIETMKNFPLIAQQFDFRFRAATSVQQQFKHIYDNPTFFHKKLNELIGSIYIPKNQELALMSFAGQFFIEYEGYNIPQLDFFMQFGKKVGAIQKYVEIYHIQRILLEHLGPHLGLNKKESRNFSLIFLEQLYFLDHPLERQPKNFQPIEGFDFSSVDIVKFTKFLASHIRLEYGYTHIINNNANQTFEIHGSERFGFDENPSHLSESCLNSGKKSNSCPEGIDSMYYRYFLDYHLYEHDTFLHTIDASNEVSIQLTKTSNSGGFFTVKVKHEDVFIQEHLTLDFDFSLSARKQNLNTVKSYEHAAKVLNKAIEVMNESWNSLTQDQKNIFANEAILSSEKEGSKSFEKNFKTILLNIDKLTYSEFLSNNWNIKNFDYQLTQNKVFVTPSYYVNYGYASSYVQYFMQVLQVRDLLMHEILHLFDISDEEASKAVVRFHSLLLQNAPDQHGQYFINLSKNQPAFLDALDLSRKILQEKIHMQRNVLRKHIESMLNIEIIEDYSYLTADTNSCFDQEGPISCLTYHLGFEESYKLNHHFLLNDGQEIFTSLRVGSTLELVSATNHSGALLSSVLFQLELGNRTDYILQLQDSKTLQSIKTIPLNDSMSITWEVMLRSDNQPRVISKF